MLTREQVEQYERDGFLILRDQFNREEMAELDAAFAEISPIDIPVTGATYPEPGRYTLAKSSWSHPGYVHFAEHPKMLNGAKTLLGDDVFLTAFVLYDRTPGGPPIGQHHDYKRWRPVGSSLNWLFTIIPMCDFDEDTGQLFVAPGSHHLDRVRDQGEGVLDVAEAVFPADDDFIDPGLKRGDLLFMNMHLWHRAAGNSSNLHRVGLFNKYAAKSYPPATGYYVYSDDVYKMFSDSGKEIIAVHSNKAVKTARLVLQRERNGESQFFLQKTREGYCFPGGETFDEQAIPDWDVGNYVEAVCTGVRSSIRIEPPWVTYVGDYDEADHLCRVYAYPMNNNGFPVKYEEGSWVSVERLAELNLLFGYEKQAITDWLDPTKIRGKAISQAKARVDQFAY